jgi:hypothetical protein
MSDQDRLAELVMALRPGLVGEMLAAGFEFEQSWRQVWSVLGEPAPGMPNDPPQLPNDPAPQEEG